MLITENETLPEKYKEKKSPIFLIYSWLRILISLDREIKRWGYSSSSSIKSSFLPFEC